MLLLNKKGHAGTSFNSELQHQSQLHLAKWIERTCKRARACLQGLLIFVRHRKEKHTCPATWCGCCYDRVQCKSLMFAGYGMVYTLLPNAEIGLNWLWNVQACVTTPYWSNFDCIYGTVPYYAVPYWTKTVELTSTVSNRTRWWSLYSVIWCNLAIMSAQKQSFPFCSNCL